MECKIAYTLKYALTLSCIMLLGIGISLLLAVELRYPIFGIIGGVFFLIVPLLIQKPIRNLFIKKAVIEFNETLFTVDIFNNKTAELEKHAIYKYKDIQKCSLNSQQNQYSTLILFFHNQNTIRYTFFDEELGVNTSEVIYQNLIKHDELFFNNNKIVLKPTFYSSKTGRILVSLLFVTLILIMLFQLLYFRKTLPVTILITVILLFQIIFKRKADDDIFKKNQ